MSRGGASTGPSTPASRGGGSIGPGPIAGRSDVGGERVRASGPVHVGRHASCRVGSAVRRGHRRRSRVRASARLLLRGRRPGVARGNRDVRLVEVHPALVADPTAGSQRRQQPDRARPPANRAHVPLNNVIDAVALEACGGGDVGEVACARGGCPRPRSRRLCGGQRFPAAAAAPGSRSWLSKRTGIPEAPAPALADPHWSGSNGPGKHACPSAGGFQHGEPAGQGRPWPAWVWRHIYRSIRQRAAGVEQLLVRCTRAMVKSSWAAGSPERGQALVRVVAVHAVGAHDCTDTIHAGCKCTRLSLLSTSGCRSSAPWATTMRASSEMLPRHRE